LNVLSKILRYAVEIELLLVAAEAGLRLGELLALEWTDIDFKNRLLTVMRNDWRGSIGTPKSGRDRKIPLTTRVTAPPGDSSRQG